MRSQCEDEFRPNRDTKRVRILAGNAPRKTKEETAIRVLTVDAAVGAVRATALLLRGVDLNVLNHKLIDIKVLDLQQKQQNIRNKTLHEK